MEAYTLLIGKAKSTMTSTIEDLKKVKTEVAEIYGKLCLLKDVVAKADIQVLERGWENLAAPAEDIRGSGFGPRPGRLT